MRLSIACGSLGAITLLAGLSGCAAPSPGPAQPMAGPHAPGVLVIDPSLLAYLDSPNAQQTYKFNDAGFLEYSVLVRNRGAQPMTLAYNADFYDGSNSPVESQDPVRFFIDPQSEKPLKITANDRKSKTVRVQIRPAK
jgi:uncharacterized protein YcfL